MTQVLSHLCLRRAVIENWVASGASLIRYSCCVFPRPVKTVGNACWYLCKHDSWITLTRTKRPKCPIAGLLISGFCNFSIHSQESSLRITSVYCQISFVIISWYLRGISGMIRYFWATEKIHRRWVHHRIVADIISDSRTIVNYSSSFNYNDYYYILYNLYIIIYNHFFWAWKKFFFNLKRIIINVHSETMRRHL